MYLTQRNHLLCRFCAFIRINTHTHTRTDSEGGRERERKHTVLIILMLTHISLRWQAHAHRERERETRENGNDNTSCTHLLLIIIVFCTIKRERRNVTSLSVEPFNGQLKPQSNGPLCSNTVIGTLVVDSWAVTFGTARGLGELRLCPFPSSLYQI